MKFFFTVILTFFSSASFSYDLDKVKIHFKNQKPESELCNNMEISLRNDEITFVKPLLTTKSEEFVKSKNLIRGCDNNAFVEYTTVLGNTGYTETLKNIEKSNDSKRMLSWHHPLNITVYSGDVNHDGESEFVIYGSCMHEDSSKPDCNFSFSNFKVINEEVCAIDKTRQVFDIGSKYSSEDIVGLLTYRGNEYFYDGRHYKNEGKYTFSVYGSRIKKNGSDYFYTTLCRFSAPSPNKSMQPTPAALVD